MTAPRRGTTTASPALTPARVTSWVATASVQRHWPQTVTIRLTERNVSRRHARILRNNGEVHIEDLGSYNGIRVNNARIAEPKFGVFRM